MTAELLVSTDWLAEHLSDPNLRVVDIRGYVMTSPIGPGVEEASYRGARDEYLAGHIPGAVYVDWTTDITDPTTRCPPRSPQRAGLPRRWRCAASATPPA